MKVFIFYDGLNDAELVRGGSLTSLDGTTIASVATIRSETWTPEMREMYGVYEVEIAPPEGQEFSDTFTGLTPVYTDLPAPTAGDVIAERWRRLALGVDYDFGDSRGVHRIGTTDQDMDGWDQVNKLSVAAILGGAPTTPIAVVTDTGPVIVTATEWQQIVVAVGQAGQPIWTASFVLQAMDPIPMDYSDDSYWP